ncbi:MAG: class I SAM-dependent methyltransferase [Betaproteobacteria bacterium]|nr:class I SAM-dependent methyltransferase [Betaproteobacteria bacterium]
MYEDKQDNYFAFVRKDIEPLLPARAGRVLEVGCGGGGTLAWLKASGRARWIAGIELFPDAAAVARTRLDELHEGDVDQHIGRFAPGSFDLILCLDVLEHLVDPWDTLTRLQALLRPGGQLIASLPNIRHHSVILPLLLSGTWRYETAGIMDRTHLRFFSRATAIDLIEQAGLQLAAERSTYAWGSWDQWKDRLTFGMFRDLLSFQYLLSARKPGASQLQAG